MCGPLLFNTFMCGLFLSHSNPNMRNVADDTRSCSTNKELVNVLNKILIVNTSRPDFGRREKLS